MGKQSAISNRQSDKNQKKVSAMTQRLMNVDIYPYTIEEASRLMRMNRDKFTKEFIETGKIKLREIPGKSELMILKKDIEKIFEEGAKVYSLTGS